MTTLLVVQDSGAGTTRPGWNIVADLTPRELMDARRLKRLHRLIVVSLAVVLFLCATGFVLAWLSHRSSASDLAAATEQSRSLATQQAYRNVTNIEAWTTDVTAKLQGLTANDVDVAGVLKNIRHALPNTMSLTSVTVTITPAQPGQDTMPSLDSSAHAKIGTVTLNGTASRLVDVADYVTALSLLPGVTDVVPGTNTAGTAGTAAAWSITFKLTDVLLVHSGTTSGGSR